MTYVALKTVLIIIIIINNAVVDVAGFPPLGKFFCCCKLELLNALSLYVRKLFTLWIAAASFEVLTGVCLVILYWDMRENMFPTGRKKEFWNFVLNRSLIWFFFMRLQKAHVFEQPASTDWLIAWLIEHENRQTRLLRSEKDATSPRP